MILLPEELRLTHTEQHEHESSESSKQSWLLSEHDGSEQGSSNASASLLISSPLVSNSFVTPPPGYV